MWRIGAIFVHGPPLFAFFQRKLTSLLSPHSSSPRKAPHQIPSLGSSWQHSLVPYAAHSLDHFTTHYSRIVSQRILIREGVVARGALEFLSSWLER
jgi:hypothetical protein